MIQRDLGDGTYASYDEGEFADGVIGRALAAALPGGEAKVALHTGPHRHPIEAAAEAAGLVAEWRRRATALRDAWTPAASPALNDYKASILEDCAAELAAALDGEEHP